MYAPPPPMMGVPPPPPSAVPLPPSSAVPPPPSSAVPPPPSSAVPPPPPSAVPPPPSSTVPLPPTSAVPPPPPSTVPLPPTSAVPPPPPSAVPPPPSSTVPLPPTSAVPPPPSSTVPLPPTSAVPPPPPSAVPPPPSSGVPLPPPGVPAPAPPPGATAQPAAPGLPAPVTWEQWQRLEQQARQPVVNQEGTRYLDVDEVVRDAVCKLFIMSNYDVLELLTNVTRSLQHVGRYDVGLLRNESLTAFTVTQSAAYGGRGADASLDEVQRRRFMVEDAVRRMNQADTVSREAFQQLQQQLAVPPSQTPQPLRATAQQAPDSDPFRRTAYEELMDIIARQREPRAGQRRGAQTRSGSAGGRARDASSRNRSAPAPANRQGRSSAYDGSYLLRRYGGQYSADGYYTNYRYNGLPRQ